MSVQIIINGENANETLAELTNLSRGLVPTNAPALVAAAPEVAPVAAPEAEKPRRQRRETPKAEPTADAEPQEPTEPTEPDAGEPVKTDGVTLITLEVLRAKMGDLARAGKQAEVKKIIADCGGTKLTDIPEDRYGEAMAAAEALS